MEEEKWFALARKSVSTSRNKFFFKSCRKNLQIKEYCFRQTENRFPLAEMKNLFKNTFLLDKKTAYIGRNI